MTTTTERPRQELIRLYDQFFAAGRNGEPMPSTEGYADELASTLWNGYITGSRQKAARDAAIERERQYVPNGWISPVTP